MSKANYYRFADKIDEQKFIWENIEYTLEKCGLTDLLNKINVKWSNHLTHTAAHAKGFGKIITISNDLWERADQDQRRELVVHETCHLCVFEKYKLGMYRSHGIEWQNFMQLCGFMFPKRCHDIEIKKVRKKRRFLYACGCCKHVISARKHNKVARNEIMFLRCVKCGQPCQFVKEIVEEMK